MSASAAKSGRPSWATPMWIDNVNVYVELPTKGPVPYIQKFALTDAGLNKALNLMRSLYEVKREPGTYSFGENHPLINRNKPLPKFDDKAREAARAILKKAGIL